MEQNEYRIDVKQSGNVKFYTTIKDPQVLDKRNVLKKI
jgi:hypothetical protein